MAEKIETPSPDLSALQADLESSLAGMPSEPALQLDDSLPAKPDAIDAYKNSVGNPITGSNPGLKFSSPSDFARNSLKESSTIKDDPYTKMRPFTYNADYDGANFDRYYGTDAYKTLGFSPYRDNDALYNQKMTFGDQFVRAAGQWGNLMSTGFMSGVKTWGTLFTDPLAPDLESARDMKRAMAIGNISTGGLGGFIGNTFLNSAYSIGIGLEFLAEEAALAAATAFTGGMAGEVTLPAMAARGGMFGRALTRIAETGAKIGGKADRFAIEAERLGEFSKRSKEVLDQASGGNDIKSAINFFNKTIDVINPFEKTAEALRSQRYATDLAKTVGTAGAFADDIIRIKTAASEAKLEGGMVMIDATEKLIDQYRDEHGVDPTGEDLKNIHALASAEARRTTLYNFPAILTTNNLLFATILYPLNKSIGNTTGHLLKETITGDIKAGTKIFSQLEKGAAARIKAAAKSLTKPSIYGEYGMAYMKANLGEGIQENVQEAISNGAINHALAYQKDPAMASYRGYMGYLMDGMKDQLNAQGAETFASGFLMGMFTQPIMTAPAWAMTKGIEKLQNKDKLKEIKDQRDAAIKKQVDTLNDMDINFWGKDLALAVKNGALARDFAQSLSVGDEKGARDSKFALEFQHIGTAIQSGKFEDLMARLADYKNLSPQQALEAFQRYNIGINTEAEAEAALKHIDGVIERANSIKDRYEKVVENFPNPYDYTSLKPGSNERKAMMHSYMAWEEAQKNLVFAHSEFENHSNRLSGIADTFSALASEIAKTDTQSLLSTLSKPAMATEIAALKKEISVLGEVEGQAAVKKDKEKTLKLLENFYEEIQKYQDKTTVAGATEHLTFYDKALPYERAKEAYRKYLNHLAKKNDTILFDTTTDKAFDLVADSLELRREQYNLGRSINVLSNPKGFLLLQKRLQDAFAEENKKARIEGNMIQFMMMNDENQILQTLGEMGVKVSEDFLKEYKDALKNGKPLPVPQSFFDPTTQKPITFESEPEKYEMALEAWEGFKRWMEEEHNIQEPVEEEEEAKEGTEEEKEAVHKYDTYDDELRLALETNFNHYKDVGEIPEDMNFGKFLLSDKGKEIIHIYYAQQNIEKNNAKKAAQEKKEGIPLGTKVNPEARATLNQMGYTNTQIDALSREEREKILKGGIPAEDYYKGATGVKGTIKLDGKVVTMEGVPGSIDFTGNQKDTNFDTMMPEITKLLKNWDKAFVNDNLVNYDGQFIFNYSGRVFVLIKVGNFIVPYYFSSSGTSGKTIDWHYVFGIDDDAGWIIKGDVDKNGEMIYDKRMAERYPKAIAELERIKKEIRSKLSMTPETRDTVRTQLDKYNLGKKYSKSINDIYKGLDVVKSRSGQGIEVNENYDYLLNATLGLIGLDKFAPTSLTPVETITEEPVEEAIHPDYVGKIVFMTPGSGKTTFVKNNPDAVIDTDELLLETIQELMPSFTPDPNLTPGKNIYEAIRYAKVDKSKLYAITLGKMKAAAARGMTVLTGSPAYFKNADYILLQQDEKLVTKGYDQYNKETLALAELEASDPKFQKEAIILGVFGYAEDVLKASPLETLALYKKTQITTEPISENVTIEDINENITPNNLVIAKDRGYDAVYNNKRYAIGNVTENSVSLRSLDGEEITVKPEEISGVAQQETVVETSQDTETVKNNNTTTEQKGLNIDDAADDLNEAAKNILKNICK